MFTLPILLSPRLDSCGQRYFRPNELHSVDATTRALDKSYESTEEREAEACIKRAPGPARYPFLFSSGFLTVELGGSRQDERVADCGNPSHESKNFLPQPSYRVPVPRNTGCKHRLILDEPFSPGRILFEPEELCRPSWVPMVGDNLMSIFKSFRETVPVSRPAKFLLRHWRCESAAKQRPQVNRSDFAPGRNLPLLF